MTTLRADDDRAISEAMAALDGGALVVVPGDLCYLVAADALDDDAVARLFHATSRSADRPLTVLVSGYEDLHHVAFGGAEARALVDAHWPGPAALALRARPWLPDALTAGLDEVAVCAPGIAFTRSLARQFGPLAVAAAREKRGAPALDADAARRALGAEAALVIDAGALPGGEAKIIRG